MKLETSTSKSPLLQEAPKNYETLISSPAACRMTFEVSSGWLRNGEWPALQVNVLIGTGKSRIILSCASYTMA